MSPKEDAVKAAEELEKDLLIAEAQVDQLNWVIKLLGTGMPNGMVRGIIEKRIVEITGEGG